MAGVVGTDRSRRFSCVANCGTSPGELNTPIPESSEPDAVFGKHDVPRLFQVTGERELEKRNVRAGNERWWERRG